MKTKIKRHSRSVLSVVLAVCMLVSCMTVGLIASDAAKVTGDEAAKVTGDEELGATEYLILRYNNNDITSEAKYVSSSSKTFTIKASDFGQTSFETGKNYYIGYSTSNSYTGIDKGSTNVTIGTKDSGISGFFPQNYSVYKFAGFSLANSNIKTVTVTVSGSAPYTYSLTSSTTDSGGSSGGSDPSKGTAPAAVVSGTDIMFYIESYNGTDIKLGDANYNDSPGTFTNLVAGKSYVQVTKSTAGNYQYITNNPTSKNWAGVINSSIGTGSAGSYYVGNSNVYHTDAKTAATTLSPSSINTGTSSITLSTTCDSATGVYNSLQLYTQYYLDGTYVTGSEATASTSAKSFTLNTSSLSAGLHTLKTILTDGNIFYIADTDTLTVTAEKKHAVTISASPSEGGSVSPATGTEIGEETATQITATPNAGYQFNGWTFGDGINGESTSDASTTITTKSSGTYSVTASFTKKNLVVTVEQPDAGGTIASDKDKAQIGDTVTITAIPDTGYSLSAISYSSTAGSGTASGTGNTRTFTMPGADTTVTATFNADSGTSNFYYNSYGSNGQPASTHYGAQMTEAKINGETYSYYHVTGRTENDQLFTVSYGSPKYNSYDCFFEIYKAWESSGVSAQFYATDGNAISDWTNMTWVEDKTSTKKFKVAIPDGARSVKFKNNAGNQDKTNELFFTSGYNGWYHSGSNFTDVTGYNQFTPVSTSFWENFNSTKYTNAFNTGGFYGHNVSRGESHAYTKPKDLDSTTKGDYYIVVLYENKTYTINGVTKTITNNPEIIWMPTLPSAVPDNTETVDIYAKDACLRNDDFNRFAGLADTVIDQTYFEYSETNASTGEVTTYTSISAYNTAHSSKQIAYTTYTTAYGTNGNGAGYVKMTNVPVGAKVKIKTTLSNSSSAAGSFNSKAFRDTHYLKAYSFNGMSYQVNSYNSSGEYEEIWTVRAVNTTYTDSNGVLQNATTEGKAVEVTPIYYLKDNTNCKTFYIDGYDGTVQNAWGNLLSVYPYYEGMSNSANAFGGYPGQPMLFWGGKYQMEVPLTVDGTASGASVKGLTLHNAYWDLLHRSLDIRCNTRDHAQTYDYDDFYKLYKEKNPDTIIFDFKYRTTSDNYSDGYDYTNYSFAGSAAKGASDFTSANGVELVTDYYGRQVDAFGTLISSSNQSDWDDTKVQDKELLFVSTGYKDTYVGEYATIWAVYAPQSDIPNDSGDSAGSFIGYISSSMLYLNNIGRVNQYTDGTNTNNGRMSWDSFISTYNKLKSYYTGVPALISYEKEIWNNTKDKANRSDGKWYYSFNTDKIEANIIIQYGSYSLLGQDVSDTTGWTTDNFSTTVTGTGGEYNVGNVTGCSAYFTNTSPYLVGKVESGEQFADNSSYFNFKAVPSGNYQFAGWVRYSGGKYYEITDQTEGQSNMSANDTYIARFVAAKSGTLVASHNIVQNATYTGTGTATIQAVVKNGDTTVATLSSSDGSDIDLSSYIKSANSAYTIDITMTTTPTSGSDSRVAAFTSSSANYPGTTTSTLPSSSAVTFTVAQFTVQSILDSGVKALRYISYLDKTVYTYQYEITYNYTSRFWGEQSYKVTGTFANETIALANMDGTKNSAKLTTAFIQNQTPYEKNFRQTINWNYTTSAVGNAAAMVNNTATAVSGAENNTYKLTATVFSANVVDDTVTAEFILPYKYGNQESGYTSAGVDVYTAADGNKVDGTSEIVFDESYESVQITKRVAHLFTYDNSSVTGSDSVRPSDVHLVEAAPYVIKGATNHTHKETVGRYFSGSHTVDGEIYAYFTVNNINYYYGSKPDSDITGVVLTDSYTATLNGTTYTYAVKSGETVYSFSDTTAAGNGQYGYYYLTDVVDGVVQNTGTKWYFTRWDIYNSDGDYVASSYHPRFNFSGYENYVVKPVYESATDTTSSNTGTSATITYLGDSRNQWNNDGSGNYASVTGKTDLNAADKLFADFAIAYNYNGQQIQTIANRNTDSTNGHDIKIGMVIEQVCAVDSGITDNTYYANLYKSDFNASAIKKALENNTSLKIATGHNTINSKIGANVSGWGTQFGAEYTSPLGYSSVIDNFNRLQWFYTFNSSINGNDRTDDDYVYRASAYIIVDGIATVSSTPVYFNLYTTAKR